MIIKYGIYEGCSKITWTFALTGNSFDTEKQKLYDMKQLFFFFFLCKFQTIRTCNYKRYPSSKLVPFAVSEHGKRPTATSPTSFVSPDLAGVSTQFHFFSKYSPRCRMHRRWRCTHWSNMFSYHCSSNWLTIVFTATLKPGRLLNFLPLSCFLIVGKTEKSIGARSGEYGGWLTVPNPIKLISSLVDSAVWGESCCHRKQSIGTPGRFFFRADTKSRRWTWKINNSCKI